MGLATADLGGSSSTCDAGSMVVERLQALGAEM
jgi:hypothetical protein